MRFHCILFIIAENYSESDNNPFLILWFIASLISSCYTYAWDIKMDWGLFEKTTGENRFLREEIVYSSTVSILKYI